MVFLMQIPGFGLLFSMIVLSAIGDISRFDSPKKLVGYAGLGAGVHDSGKNIRINPLLRKDAKNCAGLWSKLLGLLCAVIPTGKLNMSISSKPNTLTKPLLRLPEKCWFPSGTSSPTVSLIATPMMTRWPTNDDTPLRECRIFCVNKHLV